MNRSSGGKQSSTSRSGPRAANGGGPDSTGPEADGLSGTALVVHVLVKKRRGRSGYGGAPREDSRAWAETRLEEAIGLAEAIALEVLEANLITVAEVRAGTYLGTGKIKELAAYVRLSAIDVVIFDCSLTPVQQRNLEKSLGAKVIDRTGLILEIFGARAATREGRLQVELAHLSYQRSRLVRSWTHLERQRGGFGFLGGPGETQIEADRRVIDDRIGRIKGDLEKVKRTRTLHRKNRQKVPNPVVALVGYTNAGKSTLFNRLTGASVFVEDQLFATLDPTMRGVDLPSGRRIILSDTVGFISELPTALIAAFRATLEEVLEADIILHVRDVAHENSEFHKADVEAVLEELGFEGPGAEAVEVWNKMDLLDSAQRRNLIEKAGREEGAVALSAKTGEGAGDLLELLDNLLAASQPAVEFRIPLEDGARLAWLYRHGEVTSRRDEDGYAHLTVRLAPADLGRFEKQSA